MDIRVVEWNVNGYVRASQPELLASLEWDIACLQEVTRTTWDSFRALADDGGVAFDHLPPLAGPGPRYATAVLIRGGFTLTGLSVLPDMPSPERAAVAELEVDRRTIWVGSWAAPPGVSWGKAGKGRQVERFAAWLAHRPGPVIVGIDRNAPKWEHHDLAEDEWWNSREPLLYGVDRVHALEDAYRTFLALDAEEAARVFAERPDGPLAVTHARGGVECRYDAIYASPEFEVVDVAHHWDAAREAGSDHAMVTSTLRLGLR